MIQLVFGIVFCIALCAVFVLFVRPKPDSCAGRSCSVCRDATECDLRESNNE